MASKYIFTNIIGTFVFDNQLNLVEKGNSSLANKYKNAEQLERDKLKKVLGFLKNPKFFDDFYYRNLELAKKKVKESVKEDLLILQVINNLDELDKLSNVLAKRLREWYSYYLPEFSEKVRDHIKFVELIIKKNKNELLSELNLSKDKSMGADLAKEDVEPILDLANHVNTLYRLREKQEKYLDRLMEKVCPNMKAITGSLIGAKLLEQAGSLKRLMEMPASTVQLLGAEEALFRHMKTGSRPPKYGFLHEHSFISKVKKEEQGKVARTLADKISIAVKIDYFKGKFIGDKLRKEIEDKFVNKKNQ